MDAGYDTGPPGGILAAAGGSLSDRHADWMMKGAREFVPITGAKEFVPITAASSPGSVHNLLVMSNSGMLTPGGLPMMPSSWAPTMVIQDSYQTPTRAPTWTATPSPGSNQPWTGNTSPNYIPQLLSLPLPLQKLLPLPLQPGSAVGSSASAAAALLQQDASYCPLPLQTGSTVSSSASAAAVLLQEDASYRATLPSSDQMFATNFLFNREQLGGSSALGEVGRGETIALASKEAPAELTPKTPVVMWNVSADYSIQDLAEKLVHIDFLPEKLMPAGDVREPPNGSFLMWYQNACLAKALVVSLDGTKDYLKVGGSGDAVRLATYEHKSMKWSCDSDKLPTDLYEPVMTKIEQAIR